MNKLDNRTRINKFEKRRKNTKMISVLLVVGSVLLVILLAVWIFGGNDKKDSTDPQQNNVNESNNHANEDPSGEQDQEGNSANDNNLTDHQNNNDSVNNEAEDLNDDDVDENNNPTDDEDEDESDLEEVSPSDDNVSKAYTGNWQPIGTEQSGPHTTKYGEGTTDRNEMEEAVRMATGLDEMITWWLGNGGDQKVIATVSDMGENEIYRVYLSWIDNEGWQPTKVEELIVNDKGKP